VGKRCLPIRVAQICLSREACPRENGERQLGRGDS
jgi:hypothetical protein